MKGKIKINFSANFGVKQPTIDTNYITDYPTSLRHYNIALMNDHIYSKLISENTIAQWEDPNRDMDYYSYTNYINTLLGTGQSQTYNLNLSGGNDFVVFLLLSVITMMEIYSGWKSNAILIRVLIKNVIIGEAI